MGFVLSSRAPDIAVLLSLVLAAVAVSRPNFTERQVVLLVSANGVPADFPEIFFNTVF